MADSNNLYGDIGFYSIFDGVVTRHITTYDTSASNATVLDFTLNAGVINLVPSDDDKTVNVASLKVYEDANTQFLTTDKNTFDFVKNVRVMGSEYVANDILASGHVIGSTLNVKREFADSNKVGFGLRVTENSNLELFSYDSITDTTRRVMMWTGMQGTTQGNDSNYNYSVFDISSNLMYNVSSADSNTIIYQGGSGGSVWSTIGSNAYYFDGNVGVGTSNANLAYNFTVGGSMYAAGYCNLLVNSTSDTSLNKAPTANALRTTYNKLVALSNDFANLALSNDVTDTYSSNVATWSSNNLVPSAGGTFTGAIGIGGAVQGSETLYLAGDMLTTGDIIPTTVSTQVIGTSNNPFAEAWIDTLHISQNTLYIGDTPVIGTDADTIMVQADPDQSIHVKSTGTGNSTITSEAGVQIQTTGLNSQVVIQSTGSGGSVAFGASNEVRFTAPTSKVIGNMEVSQALTVTGNTLINGNLTVSGSNFITNTETVLISDNLIVVNDGQVGSGVSAGQAGLKVDRGDLLPYLMVFDEAQDMFMVGEQGDLEVIASQPWAASNFMAGSNNLSEITDAAIARTTLGLGVNDSVTFSNIDTNTLTVNNDAFVTGTMVAGAFESVSDSNLKRDAVSISDGINVINQLNPVTFYWKENNGVVSEDLEGKLDAGFLAQQVENALPLAVSSTLGDVLSVKYDRVIPYLVSAVKELSATVEDLKTRLGASA